MKHTKSKEKIQNVIKLFKVREELRKLTLLEKQLKEQVYASATGENAYQAGDYLVSIDWSRPRLVWDGPRLINYLKEKADHFKKETRPYYKISIKELSKKAA